MICAVHGHAVVANILEKQLRPVLHIESSQLLVAAILTQPRLIVIGVGLTQYGEQDGERIGPITGWLHSAIDVNNILQGLLQELWR